MANVPRHPGPTTLRAEIKSLKSQSRQADSRPRLAAGTLGVLYDSNSHAVVSADELGEGLARPGIGYTTSLSRFKDWPKTSVGADANGSNLVGLVQARVWRASPALHIEAVWQHTSSQPAGQWAGEVALRVAGVEVYREFLLAEQPTHSVTSRFDISYIPHGAMFTVELLARGSTNVTSVQVGGQLHAVMCIGRAE